MPKEKKKEQLNTAAKFKEFERLKETSLGKNRLVEPLGDQLDKPNKFLENNREWYIGQAVLMETYKELDKKLALAKKEDKPKIKETQDRLALAMLQSYAKAASMNSKDVGNLSTNVHDKKGGQGIQTTPLFDGDRYYRSSEQNLILDLLREETAEKMGLSKDVLQVVSDSSIQEVLKRNFPLMDSDGNRVETKMNNETELTELVVKLKKNILDKKGTDDSVFTLDLTSLYQAAIKKDTPVVALKKLTEQLEGIITKQLDDLTEEQKADLKAGIHQRIQPVVFDKCEGIDVLLALSLFKENDNTSAFMSLGAHDGSKLDSAMIESGTRIDPITAKENLLKFKSPVELLKKLNIQPMQLATTGKSEGDKTIPEVIPDVATLIKQPLFKKFKEMDAGMKKPVPPYIEIYSKATADLLEGLTKLLKDKGGIDQVFKDRGIDSVLQVAYYRIIDAMKSALHHKEDVLQFMNAIELVHDQMQMILSVTQPYEQNSDFGKGITKALGKSIPSKYKPIVHHKASAMHCLSSVFSSVEMLKGENEQVQLLALKDNYYEAAGASGFDGALQHAKAHKTSVLDGSKLKSDGVMTDESYEDKESPKKGTLDLYVCDFHHNISVQSDSYDVEDLMSQVDALYEKGIPSKTFTVAIDCTVDFIESKEIKDFVAHFESKIDLGELNIVLFRSAQKFDMLGMDNYYGGFTVTINNGDKGPFKGFNERMNKDDDQVSGLAHQGLTHTAEHGAEHLEAYRKGLMENTQYLYKELIKMGLGDANSPIYIAPTTDPNAVFLDIQFPETKGASMSYSDSFYNLLLGWAHKNNLGLTTRPSFGFATSNLTTVPPKLRLNPGLEDKKAMDKYLYFFKTAAEKLTAIRAEVLRDNPGLTGKVKAATLQTYYSMKLKADQI